MVTESLNFPFFGRENQKPETCYFWQGGILDQNVKCWNHKSGSKSCQTFKEVKADGESTKLSYPAILQALNYSHSGELGELSDEMVKNGTPNGHWPPTKSPGMWRTPVYTYQGRSLTERSPQHQHQGLKAVTRVLHTIGSNSIH